MDRTGPKMGFRSPKGEKKCQKWIEQAQKASKSEFLKMGRHPLFGYFYRGYPGDTKNGDIPGLLPTLVFRRSKANMFWILIVKLSFET